MPRTGGPLVEAPCTSGNFGPGFDVFSLAVARRGDRCRVTEADADAVHVTGVDAGKIPAAFDANCAAVAVDHLRRAVGLEQALRVDVDKGVPPGSGLGSSASSSAAGALAFYHAYRNEFTFTPTLLLAAAVAGERVGAGGDHRDDVAAALFGGLAVVPPDGGLPWRLDPPATLHLAYVLPAITLETRRMRGVLPKDVPRADAVFNLHQVARMVDAVARGDVADIGRALEDRLAVPYRAPFVTGYEAARRAALDVGAFGFTLSGSGPACLAVTDSVDAGRAAVKAAVDAFEDAGVDADGFVAGPSFAGVDDAAVDVH